MSATYLPYVGLLSAWDTWLFSALLVIGLPSFAYLCLFKGAQGDGYFGRLSKTGIYLWIVGSLWLMLALMAIVAHRHGLSLHDLGQHLDHPMRLLAITGGLVAFLAVATALNLAKHKKLSPSELDARLSRLKHFFPTTPSEVAAFIALSITAGICEELLFRGWALHLSAAGTGSIWLGLLISSIAFGLAHAYQGVQGIASTGVVGLLLGLLFVWAGSLLPAQIVHACVNLSSGLLYAYLFAHRQNSSSAGMQVE